MKSLRFFILVLSFNLNAQNLVPNYSFENCDINGWLTSGLLSTGGVPNVGLIITDDDMYPNLNTLEQYNLYWSFMDDWVLPDRRYPWCGFGFPSEEPIPSADITYEPLIYNPNDLVQSDNEFLRYFSGDLCVYTGTGPGEFILVESKNVIESGHTYYIEAFVGTIDEGIDSHEHGTIDLFTQKPHVCSTNEYITDYGGNGPHQTVLDVNYQSGYSQDSLGWVRFKNYFVAEDDFEWISLGAQGTFYWDDIKLIEIPTNQCKDEWFFDNTVFNYPLEIFQAGNFIKAGTGVDPEVGQLDGPVTVLSTSHTIFRAGNAIYLEPGFEVDSLNGAIFEAIVEPCIDLCPPSVFLLANHNCIDS